MHEQHREDAKQRPHTGSESSYTPGAIDVGLSRLKWFYQGGRKIFVGDTALFRAGNALPFIGIIRKVITDKEDTLKLRVNWLYRPGDIELVKGLSLDASPNEVFYSFHKDAISAASLLHPCKISFLPNGVNLPPEVSSLICRRVYDISRKSLYWLTDRDYADEHQGEVDRLLKKTKHEMLIAGQPEKSSLRALIELKPEAVHVAQGKSQKRERTDQILDSANRERHCKEENMDLKRERNLRFEDFTIIAENNGGLWTTSLVDQLVQVMAEERMDGSNNLADVVSKRLLLVGIVAAMDKEDCLSHFVRCGGLPVLDEWLQEAHKGCLGDVHHKESDKDLEELLFNLLRALERLPVDIDALRTSNVGKSVNFLKTHKSFELQKKARKLVETWKKRVNAEMNQLDEAKSAPNSTTWSLRPAMETFAIEGSFGGGFKGTSSAQLAINGSVEVGEASSASGYKVLTDASASKTNSLKAHTSGATDAVPADKEEKSCSSSQSWCSELGKSVGSLKEEDKVPSVALLGNKTGTALRSQSKGHYPVVNTSAALQRDSLGKHRPLGVEKTSNSTLSDKKGNEVPNYNNQRLIVRLPNPGRSPAHSTSGGCLTDVGGSNNKGFSSAIVERHDSINTDNKAPEIHSPGTSGDAKLGDTTIKVGKARVVDLKEYTSGSCIDSVDNVAYKSTFVATKNKPAANTFKKCINLSIITATLDSNNINVTGVSGETIEGGIDLLSSIAACEGSEAEKSMGESAGEERCHHFITETSRDFVAQGRLLDEQYGNVEAREDSVTSGEKKIKDETTHSDCKPHMTCVRGSDPSDTSALLPELHPEVASSLASSFSMHGKEEGQIVTDAVIDANITDGKTSNTVEATAINQDAQIAREEFASDSGASPHENARRARSGVVVPEVEADNYQVMTPNALDNVTSLEEGSENGSKDLSSPSTLNPSPSHANAGDIGLEFYGEDALEVARLVAKEVEQEVQGYGCHEAHGAALSSSDEKDSNLDGGELLKQKQSDADDATVKDLSVNMLVEDAAPAEGRGEAGMEDRDLDGIFPSIKDSLDISSTGPKDAALSIADPEIAADNFSLTNDIAKIEGDSQFFAEGVPKVAPIEEITSRKETFLPKCKKLGVVERPLFDLNKGLVLEECFHDRVTHSLLSMSNPSPIPDRTGISGHSSSLAAPVAIVSAMKGSFIPPCNITRPKAEWGWKGSAATSAFRPAEPRRMAETLQSGSDATVALETVVVANDKDGKQACILNIDLNMPDDKVMEQTNLTYGGETDAVSNAPTASRPELDLNRVDGSDESPLPPQSNGRLTIMSARAMLDFDLNDGLGYDDAGANKVSSHLKIFEGSMPVVPETSSMPDSINVIPWYNSTSSIPAAMVIPAFSTNRPDLPYPVVAVPGPKSAFIPSNSFSQFGGNTYQEVAPMSSVNVGVSPTTFPHSGYSSNGGFPFSSTTYTVNSASNVALNSTLTFASVPSPLVSVGAVVSPFGRPYAGGCIGDSSSSDSFVSWARPTLDLNSDVLTELDSKDEVYSIRPSLGQLQYQQVGSFSGSSKRKEPEGGFDAFRSSFKQTAWRE